MATSHSGVGARSVGAGGKKKGGLLKWLLPLLLLLVLAIVLIALLSGGDDDSERSGATQAPAASAAPDDPSSRATGGAAAGAGAAGTLVTVGDVSLLGADAEAFGGAVGEQATGRGIEVLSVIENEGFFVGTSEQDRVYVEFGAEVGENETARDYQPSAGDRVDLRGEIRPAPQEPGRTLHLEQADARVVERQGAFINATNVSRKFLDDATGTWPPQGRGGVALTQR